jgi:hypothetical protein
MTVRDLMRKLIEVNQDEQVLVDAAGRGTFEIAVVEKAGHSTILMTDRYYYERESMHDIDERMEYFADVRD